MASPLASVIPASALISPVMVIPSAVVADMFGVATVGAEFAAGVGVVESEPPPTHPERSEVMSIAPNANDFTLLRAQVLVAEFISVALLFVVLSVTIHLCIHLISSL